MNYSFFIPLMISCFSLGMSLSCLIALKDVKKEHMRDRDVFATGFGVLLGEISKKDKEQK